MKTIFWILFFVAILIYSSKPTIQFQPFKITFEQPFIPFAILFLTLSVAFFQVHAKTEAQKQVYKEAYKNGINDMANELKKQINYEN